MTINNSPYEKHKKSGRIITYREVELKETKDLLYDENPTPLQKNIEMFVTNRRGYLSIQNALDIVNKNFSQISLYDVLDDPNIIPFDFEESSTPTVNYTTFIDGLYCNNKPLKVKPSIFHPTKKTLLERLRIKAKNKGLIKNIGTTPHHSIHDFLIPNFLVD